jgi:hypothetical protein
MACRIWFSHLHSLRDLAVLDQCADRLRSRAAGAGGGRRHRHSGHPPTQTTRRAWLKPWCQMAARGGVARRADDLRCAERWRAWAVPAAASLTARTRTPHHPAPAASPVRSSRPTSRSRVSGGYLLTHRVKRDPTTLSSPHSVVSEASGFRLVRSSKVNTSSPDRGERV